MKNKKGFTLVEVMIAAGLMGMLGVYMMQMTNNMNQSISRMETRADEQELMYITTLAMTDKLACQRTLGSYCEKKSDQTAAKNSSGEYIWQQSNCNSLTNQWVNNDIELKEWNSADDFKLSSINDSNSTDIKRTVTGDGIISDVGKIYNRNFGIVFKACTATLPTWMSASTMSSFPGIDNAYAIPMPTLVPGCEEQLYYVGQTLMLKKFLVANYPEDQGGVPMGGGVGKVKFVFEYARLKEKGKIMRKDIDLYVETNTNDKIKSCLSANDVETFAADSTYVLEADFSNGSGGVSADDNCENKGVDADRCYSVSCAKGDELINGDAIALSNHIGIRCDLSLDGGATDACTEANCINSIDDSFKDTCPSECRSKIYTKYECREYGDINNLKGVRVICARRYSN